MPRIRTIKPEFPQSESMGRCSREARLCFILLWTLSDDAGRLRGNEMLLARLLYPYDDDAMKLIGKWLAELTRERCIQTYKVDGDTYVQILQWKSHQRIDKPTPSKIPAPPEAMPMPEETKPEATEQAPAEEAPASAVLLTYPTDGKVTSWHLTEAHVAEWSALYPSTDVLAACRKALAWIMADSQRKKTAGGMKRFLVGWLNRETNAPSRPQTFTPRGAVDVAALQAGGKAEASAPVSIQGRLQRLADSLPEALNSRDQWQAKILSLSGDSERIEAALSALDADMVRDLRDMTNAETMAEFDATIRAGWERVKHRVSGETDAHTFRQTMEATLIRDHYGAPVLTLFGREAREAA